MIHTTLNSRNQLEDSYTLELREMLEKLGLEVVQSCVNYVISNKFFQIKENTLLDETYDVSLKRLSYRITELKKQYNYELQKRKK